VLLLLVVVVLSLFVVVAAGLAVFVFVVDACEFLFLGKLYNSIRNLVSLFNSQSQIQIATVMLVSTKTKTLANETSNHNFLQVQ
jgi:hypothetical protein